jgi:diadenosine tetraphosphate (Ap4A) HIT family hydrolase
MSDLIAAVPWGLHPQLARDTVAIGDLSLSRILLMNDANYPWILLVPRRPDLREIIDLDEPDRGHLLAEITQASLALKSVVPCDKLNIAAIGNVVSQLHVHIVARLRTDAAWPKPVWGLPPRAYDPAHLKRLADALRRAFALD